MEKKYIIDSAFTGSSRADGKKMTGTLITMIGGMIQSQQPFEIINPTDDQVKTWVAGAEVTGTFSVTAPPPDPATATGSTGATGATA